MGQSKNPGPVDVEEAVVRIYEYDDGGKRQGQVPAGSAVRNPAELGIPVVYDNGSHHLNQLRLIPYR